MPQKTTPKLNTLGNPLVVLTLDTSSARLNYMLLRTRPDDEDRELVPVLTPEAHAAVTKYLTGPKLRTINKALIAAQSATIYSMLNQYAVPNTFNGPAYRTRAAYKPEHAWLPNVLQQTKDLQPPVEKSNLSADQERKRMNCAITAQWLVDSAYLTYDKNKKRRTLESVLRSNDPVLWRMLISASRGMSPDRGFSLALQEGDWLASMLLVCRYMSVADKFTPCLGLFQNPKGASRKAAEAAAKKENDTTKNYFASAHKMRVLIPLLNMVPEHSPRAARRAAPVLSKCTLANFNGDTPQAIAEELFRSGARVYDLVAAERANLNGESMRDRPANAFLPCSMPGSRDILPKGAVKSGDVNEGAALVFLRMPRDPEEHTNAWIHTPGQAPMRETLFAMRAAGYPADESPHRLEATSLADEEKIIRQLPRVNTGVPVDAEKEPETTPPWYWVEETIGSLNDLITCTYTLEWLRYGPVMSDAWREIESQIELLRQAWRKDEAAVNKIKNRMRVRAETQARVIGNRMRTCATLAMTGPEGTTDENLVVKPSVTASLFDRRRVSIWLHVMTISPLMSALKRCDASHLCDRASSQVLGCMLHIEMSKVPQFRKDLEEELNRMAKEMLQAGRVGPWLSEEHPDDKEWAETTEKYLTVFGARDMHAAEITAAQTMHAVKQGGRALYNLFRWRKNFRPVWQSAHPQGVHWATRDPAPEPLAADLPCIAMVTTPFTVESVNLVRRSLVWGPATTPKIAGDYLRIVNPT